MSDAVVSAGIESLDSTSVESDPHHPLRVRRAALLTASVGIVHSVLLIASFLLLRVYGPPVDGSNQELVDYYTDPGNRRVIVVVGLYLIPFAAIAFIWFTVALRMWETASATRADVLFANVQLICGTIYTALLLVSGAAMSLVATAIEFSESSVEALIAREFPHFGASLVIVFAMRMASMFVLTTSSLGRSAGILPRWFVFTGYAMAIFLLLAATLSTWLIIAFPAWLLIFCGILLNRARKIPRGLRSKSVAPSNL